MPIKTLKLLGLQMCCCRRSSDPKKLWKTLEEALMKLNEGKREAIIEANQTIDKCYDKLEKMIKMHDFENLHDEDVGEKLANALSKTDVLYLIVQNIPLLNFDSRVYSRLIYNFFLCYPIIRDYVQSRPEILHTAVDHCKNPRVCYPCAEILQLSCYFESFTRTILHSDIFFKIFQNIEARDFFVSLVAILTLETLLIQQKKLCADFLIENYDEVFTIYNKLLISGNYFVRCKLFSLLSKILKAREYRRVMFKYTKNSQNLKQTLITMGASSPVLQFFSSRLFAIFAVCPDKTNKIVRMLLRNLNTILQILENIQQDDESFDEERRFVIKKLNELTLPL